MSRDGARGQHTPQMESVEAVAITDPMERARERQVQRALQALLGWPGASRAGYGLTPIPQIFVQISADLDEAENEHN